MIAPILCAVDFSADSRAALEWACDEAESRGAPLLVLHVIHDPAASPGFYHQLEEDWIRPMAEAAEQMLAEFLATCRAARPDCAVLQTAQTRLVPGLPPGRIVEVAEAAGALLIVIGSRGRTGLAHILLGSVAERVVQTASMPVVVVKAKPEGGP